MPDQGFYIPQKDVQKLRERIAELEKGFESEEEQEYFHNEVTGLHNRADLDRIAELEARVNRTCRWKYHPPDSFNGDRFGDYYDTECGRSRPSTWLDFCPECGGKVVNGDEDD